jgi:hypothetical protein
MPQRSLRQIETMMDIVPSFVQLLALVIGAGLPLLLLGCAFVPLIRGAGARFGIASAIATLIYAITCVLLPGPREAADIVSGALFLATAILFWYVIWSLLAWGFALTLLTALNAAGRALSSEQWISAYIDGPGGDLTSFANNRLQLLLGAGVAKSKGDYIAVTPLGIAVARLVQLVRLVLGIGNLK